ncbi:MAG: hypothetical protein ACOY90_22030 [Candidatus Zhuqueibacterota bacterium]
MRKAVLLTCIVFFAFSLNAIAQDLMQEADGFWEQRGDNFNTTTLLADSTNINKAISMYKKYLSAATGAQKEEATWKLIRAYYFKGQYTTKDSELRKKIYDLGKDLGTQALIEFPESAGINLFLAIVWGVWGEEYGIMQAAKNGVAGKIKLYCESAAAVDSTFDEAGAYRVLGRVYFKAPKIWPILRWPSKETAVQILEKAHTLAPQNLITKQFLAEALYSQNKSARAISLMKEILAATETAEGIAEDADTKNEAKALLAEWEKK